MEHVLISVQCPVHEYFMIKCLMWVEKKNQRFIYDNFYQLSLNLGKELQFYVRHYVDFSGWVFIEQVFFWAEILLHWQVDLKHSPSASATSREFAVAWS